MGKEERKKFESYACNGLSDYVQKLEAACWRHRKESYSLRILDWFEPILKAVELFIPSASLAVQAFPNPGSLVLGAIVGVLQVTSRLLNYQKLTVQMLARMGRKARILLDYEKDLYKDNDDVQIALVYVYGNIIAFCQKAFRFINDKGQLRAKVKGLKLFNDFESQLGKEVQDFEHHIEDLQEKAWLCDKRRIKKLHDSQEAHYEQFGQVFAETRDHLQRHDDFLDSWLKKDEDLRERPHVQSSFVFLELT